MICVSFDIFMAVNLDQNFTGFSGKPGVLQSLGSQGVGHNRRAEQQQQQVAQWQSLLLQCSRRGLNPWVGKTPWGRTWQPPPVFVPEKFHGQRQATVLGVTKSQKRLSTHTHTHILINDIDKILSKFPLK